MGRHSNLLLLDERRRVIAIGRQVRDHQSRVRPIGTGDTYVPPPSLAGIPPQRDESFQRWQERLLVLPVTLKQALQQTYQGISPALAQQLGGDRLALLSMTSANRTGRICMVNGSAGLAFFTRRPTP